VIKRNGVNGKFLLPSLFNETYGLHVLTTETKCQNQEFYVDLSIYRIFVLNRACKHFFLHIMIFVYVCSIWRIVELKSRFDSWRTRNVVNGVSMFHLSYLMTLMSFLCSQWTPNVQIKYFVFHWSIYILFVLNGTCKRDPLQMTIFVNICSTWSIVEI
jgi:hypothetical protein